MGNIVLYKLLEEAAEPNVFELVEETVHAALELPALLKSWNVFDAFYLFSIKNLKVVCGFFKWFIKHGIKDAWISLFPEAFLACNALMHSFKANKLLLFSAPSALRVLLLLWVSSALSPPAKSTKDNFPNSLPNK